MAAAQNALRQYAFVAETVLGTTPTTPQTQLFEVVSFDGDPVAQTLTDPSIRADRQTGFARRGNTSASGNMEVAMCADNYDTFLEALLGGTWATDTLKVGTTARSFSVEEGFTDIAQYRVFNGVVLNTMNLKVTPTELVRATFGFLSTGATAFSGTSIDSTPTAITSKDKLFHDTGTITEGGSTIAYVTGIDLTFSNNAEGVNVLGATTFRTIPLGKVSVTGTMTALFESVTLWNKFQNSTTSSLSFTLAAGAETITFTLPKINYTAGKMARAENGPVQVELTFTAFYDTASSTTLTVTRV